MKRTVFLAALGLLLLLGSEPGAAGSPDDDESKGAKGHAAHEDRGHGSHQQTSSARAHDDRESHHGKGKGAVDPPPLQAAPPASLGAPPVAEVPSLPGPGAAPPVDQVPPGASGGVGPPGGVEAPASTPLPDPSGSVAVGAGAAGALPDVVSVPVVASGGGGGGSALASLDLDASVTGADHAAAPGGLPSAALQGDIADAETIGFTGPDDPPPADAASGASGTGPAAPASIFPLATWIPRSPPWMLLAAGAGVLGTVGVVGAGLSTLRPPAPPPGPRPRPAPVEAPTPTMPAPPPGPPGLAELLLRVRKDPYDGEAHFELGVELLRQGVERGVRHLERSFRYHPAGILRLLGDPELRPIRERSEVRIILKRFHREQQRRVWMGYV